MIIKTTTCIIRSAEAAETAGDLAFVAAFDGLKDRLQVIVFLKLIKIY